MANKRMNSTDVVIVVLLASVLANLLVFSAFAVAWLFL
jgi:hypothetical protein